MTEIIHVNQERYFSKNNDILNEFKIDIFNGLSKKNKEIPSKYFYDNNGSHLFNKITTHPDYYITNCELEILNASKQKITDIVKKSSFNLIDLGPGEGIKTELLMDHFLQNKLSFTYMPIDISCQYLETIARKLDKHQPPIQLSPIHSDYLNGLKWISSDSTACNLVLFLGSSIGNYSMQDTEEFLYCLHDNLHQNDYAIIGFDLQKSIDILLHSYDDSDGITRDFNLNLLHRINRELGADFNVDKFNHHAFYNTQIGAMESNLISLESQVVSVDALGTAFNFEKTEPIHVEYSYKYSLNKIEELADASGFNVIENFFDSKGYFVDSLWQVK